MTCFKVLNWRFPVHVFDSHTAYLAATNVLLPYDPDEAKKRKKPRKRLSDACRAVAIDGWERIDKEAIAKDIGKGRWREYGRDIDNEIFPAADVPRVLHWSNYAAKTVALIQSHGIPIDTALWDLVQENKIAVIGELLRQFDPSYGSDTPIYTADGEWSYDRLEQWLVRSDVYAWPRLESGKLDTSGDAFRLMYHIPGIEGPTHQG
jgi:hypothetical protein